MLYDNMAARIESYYRSCGVTCPTDISLHLWDSVVRLQVIYRPGPTTANTVAGIRRVFVDGSKPLPLRRVEIAHEIGHAVLHTGRQSQLPDLLRGKQERGGDCFGMDSLIPGYLLRDSLHDAPEGRGQCEQYIAEIYGVPLPFAARRLDLVCWGSTASASYTRESPASYDYTMRDPLDRGTEYLVLNGDVVGARKRRGYAE